MQLNILTFSNDTRTRTDSSCLQTLPNVPTPALRIVYMLSVAC